MRPRWGSLKQDHEEPLETLVDENVQFVYVRCEVVDEVWWPVRNDVSARVGSVVGGLSQVDKALRRLGL